jgi:hypothetical protein
MKRAWKGLVLGFALSGFATSGFSGSAQADWTDDWNGFWHRCELDYLRNTHWPQPFIYPDRDAQRAPFEAMVAKGWQRQNTLGAYHFDPNTHTLNRAGELAIRAISMNPHPERRTVFVFRGESPEITSARMASVENYAARLPMQGELVGVIDTPVPPAQRAGDQIDQIQSRVISSTPNPVLPPFQAAGSQGP